MNVNLFVGFIWLVYVLSFIIVRFSVKFPEQRPFYLSKTFKTFFIIIALLHFIFYSFYMTNSLTFADDVLIYPLLFLVGMALSFAGIWLSIKAYIQFRKMDVNFMEPKSEFLTKIRYPVFSGLLLIWLGVALIYNNWFGLIVGTLILFGVIRLQVKLEEKKLLAKFEAEGKGEMYKNYLRNTNPLIPKFNKNA